MTDPTATPTPTPPGGGWADPNVGDDDAGTTGRGPVTGSTTIDGWEHWVYADGSTTPKSAAQQGAGQASVTQILGPNGSVWNVIYGGDTALGTGYRGASDRDKRAGRKFLFAENVSTGEQTLIEPGAGYTTPDGQSITIGAEGDFFDVDTSGQGTGGPTRVGVQAPDPYGAAFLRFKEYDELIERGEMEADDAAAAWQRDFDEITANRDIAFDKFNLQSSLQNTATQRGRLEFDILSSSLPEGQSLNLGAAGIVPQNIVNPQDILSQGLPPLSELYGNIGNELTPISGLPDVGPLQLPPASMLDFVDPLANQTAAGSPGFLV